MMKRLRGWVLFLFTAGLVLIQFLPVDRENPPVTGEVVAHDQVMQALRNSCYDCHSNETRWPWYSRVAPVSWWIAEHVREGREHLNFSSWQGLPAEDKGHAMREIWDVVEEGVMPLPAYLRMHPEAALTDPQLGALLRWVEGQEPEFSDWN